eukprot:3989713-Pleurochrysis_carterae.AAC.1
MQCKQALAPLSRAATAFFSAHADRCKQVASNATVHIASNSQPGDRPALEQGGTREQTIIKQPNTPSQLPPSSTEPS